MSIALAAILFNLVGDMQKRQRRHRHVHFVHCHGRHITKRDPAVSKRQGEEHKK